MRLRRHPVTKPAICRLALTAMLFAMVVLMAVKLVSSFSTHAFSVSGSPNRSMDSIAKLLDALAPQGSLPEGAHQVVAALTKNDGSQLVFEVAEGTFEKTTIEPPAIWSGLLNSPTLIVSSGDEVLRDDGGISLAIGAGCSIKELKQPIPTGTTFVTPCTGSYVQAFPNIRYVGSAIIVAWKGVSETSNCKTDSATPVAASQPEYVKCIQNAIENALGDLLGKYEMKSVDTIVLPALGTGTGGVDKGIFYGGLANVVEKCLTSTKGCDRALPRRIILLVWSKDSAWGETANAIARNLARLGDKWRLNYAPDTPIAKQARYLGVLLVLLVCVILLSFRNKLPPAAAGYLPTFEGASLWLAVLGWGIVAAGAFSVLADAADLFASVGGSPYSKESVLLNIGFGAVAAASCGLIHKATKIFQEGKKG